MDQKEALYQYWLRLGDDSMILAHRLSEWCSNGPFLEEDIALSNIGLDLFGQTRIAFTSACALEGKGRTEDDLAYKRPEHEFRSCHLAEEPNKDFAHTMVRQTLFSAYHLLLYKALERSSDEQLAAFATKSLKEVKYHWRHTSRWLVRLGDGTEESHKSFQDSLDILWSFRYEFFEVDEVVTELQKTSIVPDLSNLQSDYEALVLEILEEATLVLPEKEGFKATGGRIGHHSEYLGHILSEFQYLVRAYPNSKW